MDTINNRLQEIVNILFNGNKASFAKAIDIQPSSLSNYIGKQRASKPPVDLLAKIVNTLDISADWLMIGRGKMMRSEEDNSPKPNKVATESPNNPESSHCIDNPSEYTTYLLPISSRGGALSRFSTPGANVENCERIVSPIANVDFALSVYGESMFPEYPSGSTILIKKVNPSLFIEWGKVFVLDTPNGVIMKEILKSSEEGFVTCHSINPDPKFADFDVPLREVYGMYRVLMCLTVK